MGLQRDHWLLSISRPLLFQTAQTGGLFESTVRCHELSGCAEEEEEISEG
jgi:hypothetical protein